MELSDLNTRTCIRIYAWRTKSEAGMFTGELINLKGTVMATVYSCPEVYGDNKFRVVSGDKIAQELLTLENAVKIAEAFIGVTHVNILNKVAR